MIGFGIKVWRLCLLFAVCLLSLAGCEPPSGDPESPYIPPPTEPPPVPSESAPAAPSSVLTENTDQETDARDDTRLDTGALLLQKLPGILQTMPMLMPQSGNPVYLTEDSRVILAAAGDLSGDGNDDLAIVVEFFAKEEDGYGYAEGGFGPRHIYILLGNADGDYTVFTKSESLILPHWMGGPFGDPLENVVIEDGVLRIIHYGGSSSRWGYDMRFAYDGGPLALVYMAEISFSTLTANGERTNCDFTNHRIERYSSDGDFLYGGELVSEIYLFDAAAFDEIADCGRIPFLPYLDQDHYRFDRFDKPADLNLSASQALDMVMAERYPDFEKVYIPWTRENRDNYSKLLFYEVPDYYYQGAAGTMAHFCLEIDEDNFRAVHTVIYRSPDSEKTEFYYVDGT